MAVRKKQRASTLPPRPPSALSGIRQGEQERVQPSAPSTLPCPWLPLLDPGLGELADLDKLVYSCNPDALWGGHCPTCGGPCGCHPWDAAPPDLTYDAHLAPDDATAANAAAPVEADQPVGIPKRPARKRMAPV